jgi:hypothetical protein
MSDFAWLLIASGAALIGLSAWAFVRAAEAVRIGELRYRVRGTFYEQVIRRADNPARFDAEIRLLRAVPWIAASLAAFAILVSGFYL